MELRIGTPYVRRTDKQVFLCAEITLQGKTEEAWFSVEPQFAECLTEDRLDAFVVGFLPTAMKLGADVYCEAPMTRRLKYQLEQYLIPTMAANMDRYHAITLHVAPTDAPLACKGAVGTG